MPALADVGLPTTAPTDGARPHRGRSSSTAASARRWAWTGPSRCSRCATGLSFLDIIARQVLWAREEYDVRLPLVFMDSFRTSDDTHGRRWPATRPPRRRAAAGLPAEQGAQAPRRRPDPGHLAEADPDLEWCPPGHGDLYTALRGTGLLDRLHRRRLHAGVRVQLRQPRRGPRRRGWPAGSPAPVRRSRSRRSVVPPRTARAATSPAASRTAGSCCARPRRPSTRTQDALGRPRPAPVLLHQQPVVRPACAMRDELDRARRRPRAAADQERQERRPGGPLQPRGDPDRDRDGRGHRGLRRRRS